MGRKSVAVLPQTQAILEQLGEQIKLARLRRHLSAELVAERAGVSRQNIKTATLASWHVILTYS